MLNLKDIINSSKFLDKIYPGGVQNISIHKIDFINHVYGNSLIYVYTNQKPEIDISKYGTWGVDYNTVVIELLCRIYDIEVINLQYNKSYNNIDISLTKDGGYNLKQVWDNGYLNITIDNKFIFQRITTYFHE